MNTSLYKTTACVAAFSLMVAGCENMTPGENAAVFGGLTGLGAAGIARSQGASVGESLAIGAAAGVVTGIVVYVVAKRRATERQRLVAEERARLAAARMERQRERQAAANRKRKSRYIAVDTERDSKSTGKKTVMIFDTQSKEIVGNNVYDVEKTPSKGEVAKFDTYSAEYVGTGA